MTLRGTNSLMQSRRKFVTECRYTSWVFTSFVIIMCVTSASLKYCFSFKKVHGKDKPPSSFSCDYSSKLFRTKKRYCYSNVLVEKILNNWGNTNKKILSKTQNEHSFSTLFSYPNKMKALSRTPTYWHISSETRELLKLSDLCFHLKALWSRPIAQVLVSFSIDFG